MSIAYKKTFVNIVKFLLTQHNNVDVECTGDSVSSWISEGIGDWGGSHWEGTS